MGWRKLIKGQRDRPAHAQPVCGLIRRISWFGLYAVAAASEKRLHLGIERGDVFLRPRCLRHPCRVGIKPPVGVVHPAQRSRSASARPPALGPAAHRTANVVSVAAGRMAYCSPR